MKGKWIGGLLALMVLMVSCVKPEDVVIDSLESFQVTSMGVSQWTVDAGMKVTNLSGSKLQLKEATLSIDRQGKPLMTVQLMDKVVIPRRSSAVYTLPLAIRFEGLGGLLGAGSAFASGLKDCTVSVDATVRGGWAKKRFQMEDLPLETLFRQAGIDPEMVWKQYQQQ